MKTIKSRDGTQIAFDETGEGPALVIVGGSLADHQFYIPLANELAKHFTVYNFDRRGRGQSGDTLPYTVEREVEDLGAIIAYTKEPVLIYGHSAGSALAIRAAAAGLNIAKLALADPPYTPHDENDEVAKAEHAGQAVHIQELIDKGDLQSSAKYFLSGFGLPDEELDAMIQSPTGEAMIEFARTLPYDYAMLGDGLVPTQLASMIKVPTLILAPEETPETAQALANAMPNVWFRAMEAPTHEIPPEVLALVLVEFFQ